MATRTEFFSLSSALGGLPHTWHSAKSADLDKNHLNDMEGSVVEAIAHSKYLRNQRTSFLCRFPPEIITHILSFLQPIILNRIPSSLPELTLHWVRASHVSRHWRNAALGSPELWSRIYLDVANTGAVLEYLRHSKTAPLSLRLIGPLPEESIDETHESIYNDLLHIFMETPRLQHFHIRSTWKRNSAIWDLLSRSAPSLESLTLEMTPCADAVAILPCIFNDDMPQLKDIRLSQVDAWPYNRFRDLVRLHIFDQDRFSRPHLVTFLQTLEASSATLEELVLVSAGPTNYDLEDRVALDNAPCIPLPALRYIEIDGMDTSSDGTYLHLFLSHIIIPPAAKCCFLEECEKLAPSQYFTHHGGGRRPPVIRTLVLTSFVATSCHQYVIGHAGSTLYVNSRPRREPRHILRPSNVEFLHNVEELIYIPRQDWSSEFDRGLLDALPSLRTLRLAGDPLTKPYQVCNSLSEVNEDRSRRMVRYCPQLESLYFHNQGRGKKMDLINLVETRRQCGSPLKLIVLSGFPEQERDRLLGRLEDEALLYLKDGETTGMTREEILPEFWERYDEYL